MKYAENVIKEKKMSKAIEITDASIKEITQQDKITLVDFWAPWCGPCKMMGPIIDELSADNEDINVCKMNVDDNSASPVSFGIRGIPTLIFFKNGEIIDKLVGVSSKSALQAKIDSLK